MATEIGRLIAVFSGETREFESARKRVEAGMVSSARRLTLTEREQVRASEALQRQRSAALVSQWKADERTFARSQKDLLKSQVASTEQFKQTLASVASGISAGVLATAGLGKQLLDLAKNTAAFGANLTDLSQRTGVSVGMLSVLKVGAETSGNAIEEINSSLGRYLKTVSLANSGNKEAIQGFQQLGITTQELKKIHGDSDAAVKLLIDRVSRLASEDDRLNAIQALGIRNGQALNGVIREMGDNYAKFAETAKRAGLIITPEQAQAADKFDDSLKILELQIKGMTYTVAREFTPQITDAIADVGRSLKDNQSSWHDWGEFINTEIRGVRVAAAALDDFIKFGLRLNQPGLGLAEGVAAGILKSRELHRADDLKDTVGGDVLGGQSSSAFFRGAISRLRPSDDKGAVAAKDALAPFKTILESVKRSMDLYGDSTERAKVQQEFLRAGIERLTGPLKTQAEAYERTALAVADSLDVKKKLADAEAQESREKQRLKEVIDDVNETLFRQSQEISDLMTGMPNWTRMTLDFIAAKAREGYIWSEETKQIYLNNEARKEQLRVLAEGLTRARRVTEVLVKEGVGGGDLGALGKFDPRERFEEMREQMRDVARDLTGIIDASIYGGFRGGLQRSLDVFRNVFLKQLESALANSLAGIASGGGFWSGLLRRILGAIIPGLGGGGGSFSKGGAVIGGGAGGKAFASGGYLGPGEWGWAGERGPEPIYGGRTGLTVIPNNQRSVVNHNSITINLPPLPKGSYSAPRSQRQTAEQVAAYIQSQLT